MLKFGLEEDPIAVARVSCVLYVDIRAPSAAHFSPTPSPTPRVRTPINEIECANAVAQAVYEEQENRRIERKRWVEAR